MQQPTLRIIALLVATSLILISCSNDKTPSAVHIMTIETDINKGLERYIQRGIDQAQRYQARAIVLKINTPGGSIDSTKRIVSQILASPVPIITWVGPSGSEAMSAGTFITMSGHIATMAPSTTIGAATPIQSNGEDIEGALGKKILNSTAAFGRGLAEVRERNTDWIEKAVLDGASASSKEALELQIIDHIASDIDDVLFKIQKETIQTIDGASIELDVFGHAQVVNSMNFYERGLQIISNPAILSLLLFAGIAGIAIEFLSPGNIFPGVAGLIALLASFLGVGTLLPGEAAIAFILLGLTLLILEFTIGSGGIFAPGAIVSLALGQAIAIGQASTELDLTKIFLATGAIAITVLAFIAVLLFIVAKKYYAPTHDYGTREN